MTEEINTKTGVDFINEADKIARNWANKIVALFDGAENKDQPLPEWAMKVIGDRSSQWEMEQKHENALGKAKEVLRLAEGEGSRYRFEVWADKRQYRLDIEFESWVEANEACQKLKDKFPDAIVVRLSIYSGTLYEYKDTRLLDTLIGMIWSVGTTFPRDGEDHFTLMDQTGRRVTVPRGVLSQRQDIYSRLSPTCKDHVDWMLKRRRRLESQRSIDGEVEA